MSAVSSAAHADQQPRLGPSVTWMLESPTLFAARAEQWLDHAVAQYRQGPSSTAVNSIMREISGAAPVKDLMRALKFPASANPSATLDRRTDRKVSTIATAFFHWPRLPARLVIDPTSKSLQRFESSTPKEPVPHASPADSKGSEELAVWMVVNGEKQRGVVKGFAVTGAPNRIGFGNLRDAIHALFPSAAKEMRTLKLRFTLAVYQGERILAELATGHFWIVGQDVFNPATLASEAHFEAARLLLPLWIGVPSTEQSYLDISGDFAYPGADPASVSQLLAAVRSFIHHLETNPSTPNAFLSLSVGLYREAKYHLASQFLALAALHHAHQPASQEPSTPSATLDDEKDDLQSLSDTVLSFIQFRRSQPQQSASVRSASPTESCCPSESTAVSMDDSNGDATSVCSEASPVTSVSPCSPNSLEGPSPIPHDCSSFGPPLTTPIVARAPAQPGAPDSGAVSMEE